MNEIIMILSIIAVIGVMIFVLITTLSNNYSKNITYHNDLTPEEEIIMLLKNIARNQKIIKTNTTIIAIILIIPVIVSILIWTTSISITSMLFNR